MKYFVKKHEYILKIETLLQKKCHHKYDETFDYGKSF